MPMPIPTTDPTFNLNPIRTKPLPPSSTTAEVRISFRRLSLDIPATDITTATTSSDVYYQASPLSIPFHWESQPGTPKIKSREFPIPPLTPPPSFRSSPTAGAPRKHFKSGLATAAILPRLNLNRKAHFLQRSRSPPSSRSSCSSPPPWYSPSPSSSAGTTTTESKQRRNRWARRDDSRRAEESDEHESPVSTLCFGRRGGDLGRTPATRGCSSSVMKILMRDF